MTKFKFVSLLLTALVAFSSPMRVHPQTTLTAGDMTITSNLMTFHNNIYVARGTLTVIQGESVLTADRGIYDRELGVVKAIGNVKVIKPGSVMTSDYLEAFVNEDRILARGNPRLVRIVERQGVDEDGLPTVKKTRVILVCNEVEGFNKENRYVAKGDVRLIEVPYREGETEGEALENEKNPVSDLTCEILEFYTDEDKAIARNNVEIITPSLRATGDRAVYLDRENRLIIIGNAHAIQSSRESPDAQEQVSELYANKIIHFPNEYRTIAVGEVHATVFPHGSRPGEPDEREKRRLRRRKPDEDDDETSEGGETVSADAPPDGLPPGDYTAIGSGRGAEELDQGDNEE